MRSLPSDIVVTATTIQHFLWPASEINELLNVIPNGDMSVSKTTMQASVTANPFSSLGQQ